MIRAQTVSDEHVVVEALQRRPRVPGYIHPYDEPVPNRQLGNTVVMNLAGLGCWSYS